MQRVQTVIEASTRTRPEYVQELTEEEHNVDRIEKVFPLLLARVATTLAAQCNSLSDSRSGRFMRFS
jgi:hypothetical protein